MEILQILNDSNLYPTTTRIKKSLQMNKQSLRKKTKKLMIKFLGIP